jgi:CheY-like chemotaxis protein
MSAKPRIVLCVDDDPDDQILVKDTIKELNPSLEVVSALNGVEALQYLDGAKERNQLPSLVILDINMPLMDGKQTLTTIKKDSVLNEVPVVMFTTSSSPLDKLFCEKHGIKFVTKPIKQAELYETVKLLLSFVRPNS